LFSQLLQDQQLELALVIHEPIEVEKALVDDVFVRGAFVLDDDG